MESLLEQVATRDGVGVGVNLEWNSLGPFPGETGPIQTIPEIQVGVGTNTLSFPLFPPFPVKMHCLDVRSNTRISMFFPPIATLPPHTWKQVTE